jgi:phosphohistidine phosphatase
VKLYLVRHGEAVDGAADPERPLTAQGRDDVARVGALLRQAGAEVHQIRHSGKRRAEETAALLAEALRPAGGVAALPGLAPKDDVRAVAELLKRETRPLMLVGHQPFLERLAGLLVTGEPDHTVVRLQKAGVVCLEWDPPSRTWAVLWAVTPELVPESLSQAGSDR